MRIKLPGFLRKDKETQCEGEKKKKGIKRLIVEYLSTALIAVAMLLGMAVVLGPRLGWQMNTVLSGSMEPTINVGGAVISKKIDPRAVQVGDVISFRSPEDGKVYTHRVIEIFSEKSLSFQTKGDANEDPDNFIVPAKNVIGRVYYDMPYLGYATAYAKSPILFLIMLTVPGLVIIIMEMKDVWIELSEQEKRKKEKAAKAQVKLQEIVEQSFS